MTPADFRRLALALPDTIESSHHGHPDFRAHGRVIATLHPDGEQAMVRVSTVVQQALVRSLGAAAVPANGAWGRAGCTMLRLAAVDEGAVRDALLEAWQFAAASAPAGGRRPNEAKAKPKPGKAGTRAVAKPVTKSSLPKPKAKAQKTAATPETAPRRRRRS